MTDLNLTALERALDALPNHHPGPGGVAGVVKDGKVIAARAWGYANLDTAQEMTRATRLPICSISKQFTCQVLLATVDDPARLDGKVAAFLPEFAGTLPTVRQLCDNQSGLRDYWALTILHGARAEQEFRREDALPLIARMKTGHFPPGTAYSYCNCNYRILSELIEGETGQPLADLYRRHVWEPAGMKTAVLTADTRHPEDGVVGYEGTDATGFFPADNAIFWIGDAGISASLDDMLAYERWIDATRDDEGGLYRRTSAPPVFADGTPAAYGYGLAHHDIAAHRFIGHAGALRGFRAQRLNARDARLSVVVIFNHEGDTFGAAQSLIEAALGVTKPEPAPIPEGWDGQWLADDGLLVQIDSARRSATLRYATGGETVTLAPDGSLRAPGVVLAGGGKALTMTRAKDNTAPALTPLPRLDAADGAEIAGRYTSAELGAEMEIAFRDGAAFARFTGLLGTGRMERMAPAGRDVWVVATRRSMDAPAPGDWTLILRRDDAGRVAGLTLGCWLARGVEYTRV
ncbi:MAG: D-aminopeptidase [Paracoccaceae bacterium]